MVHANLILLCIITFPLLKMSEKCSDKRNDYLAEQQDQQDVRQKAPSETKQYPHDPEEHKHSEDSGNRSSGLPGSEEHVQKDPERDPALRCKVCISRYDAGGKCTCPPEAEAEGGD